MYINHKSFPNILYYYFYSSLAMDKEELKLHTPLKFWYQHQPSKEHFNESLIPVATVKTVQKFWAVYQHCKRPSEHEDNSYLYLFKSDVKPVWQDPNNQHGGTFVLRFEKEKCDKVWEDILLGFVAKNVGECQSINGVRSKTKKDVQIAEIWVSDARN